MSEQRKKGVTEGGDSSVAPKDTEEPVAEQQKTPPADTTSSNNEQEPIAPSNETKTNPDDDTQHLSPQVLEPKVLSPTVVVAAYLGTEKLLHKLWRKFLPERVALIVIPTDLGSELLPILIADDAIPDEFIFVPANCTPVAPVELADLELLKVYVRKDGKRLFGERLPVLLNKESLVELFADDYPDDEVLFTTYAKAFRAGIRPTEVSHEFGNFVTMILRSAPCENVVIAGLCQRKFIAASEEGWNAITHLLTKLVS